MNTTRTKEEILNREIAEGSHLAETNEDRLDIKCPELSYFMDSVHDTNTLMDALAKAYYLGLKRGSKNVTR